MNMTHTYSAVEPTLASIEALEQPTVLEFGTAWCGHCRAAQPLIAAALDSRPEIDHIKVEDGKGRPLGRAFRVKLWPTLIFLRQGKEVARLVRPTAADDVAAACSALLGASPDDSVQPGSTPADDASLDDRPQFEDDMLGDLLGTRDSESTSRGPSKAG